MATTTAVLGMNQVLKLNGYEAENVTDVTINQSRDTSDMTTRKTAKLGDKAFVATLAETTIEFTCLRITGDSTYSTLNTAFKSTTANRVHVETDIVSGYFCVTNFTQEEPLTEACKVNVTLTLIERD